MAFASWVWRPLPGWGIVVTSQGRVTEGAEGSSSLFRIVWSDYVMLGEALRKQKPKDSSLNLCGFSFFFFPPKEAFNVLACWVLRE